MKFTTIIICLVCLFNLKYLIFSEVEALSREISYPLGSILGKESKHIYHVSPFQELLTDPELSELQSEPVTEKPKKRRKKKRKFKRKPKKKKANQLEQKSKNSKKTNDENVEMTTKRLKKKKKFLRKRKKKIKTRASIRKKNLPKPEKVENLSSAGVSLETDVAKPNPTVPDTTIPPVTVKPRKPVDIVVHIKMQD